MLSIRAKPLWLMFYGLLTVSLLNLPLHPEGSADSLDKSREHLKEVVIVQPGESIQEALDTVAENGTVILKPGRYTEKIWINHSVILMGERAGEVEFYVDEPGVSMIRVNASYVNLFNISINGTGHNLTWYIENGITCGVEVIFEMGGNWYRNLQISSCEFKGLIYAVKIVNTNDIYINNLFFL